MIPIYVKTVYSFLSSLITIDDLINFGKEHHYSSLCICDDNMYGTMEFIRKCEDNQINPIVGIDLNDFLLYAKNYQGYQNLMKLVTIKSERLLTNDDYRKYNSDLICIIPSQNLNNEIIDIYQDIYQYGDITNNSIKKIDIKKILCLKSNDLEALKYLHMLRDNNTISSEYDFDMDVCYDDEFVNNIEFFEKCHLVLPKYSLNLPNYSDYSDTKGLNSDDYLENLSIIGLNKRMNNKVTTKYKDRLLYELEVIKKMGFSNYFLIVYDFIKYAKSNNILVGPGRGSACGSLVSFSLGITDVDPIKYNLLFERFLNSERVTMPDIDTDFPDQEREMVIDYVIKKYGEKNVSLITTFNTFGAKMSLRDIGRVLNIPLYNIDELCKKISYNTLKENYEKNTSFRQLIDNDKRLQKLYQVSSKIEGIPKNTSIHAAGVIIAKNLNDFVPLVLDNDKYLCAYEALYLEKLGLLKMDFLSLRNLSIIEDILSFINKNNDEIIKFNDLPLEDNLTNSLFQKGDTLGIFQFESIGMKEFLKKLHPDNFTDIYNANAFYRPGPSNSINTFILRKMNREVVDYFDPSLEEILKDTKGIIVYQEQIMLIANKMANFSLGEADILRRAMSKKKETDLLSFQDKFISSSVKNGYSKELALKIYSLILEFASYGFNKSHSVAYSIISYRMAYLKSHYPLYFYIAYLNSINMDEEKTMICIKEMKKKQIKIMKPNINKSLQVCSIYYDNVVLPFTIIKGISNTISEKIILSRDKEFTDIYDFFVKMVSNNINKGTIELLIKAGCMDEFNYTRRCLIENMDNLINYANLVNDLGIENVLKPEIIKTDEYDKNDLINQEKESYGYYLTNHPVSYFKTKYDNITDIININKYFNKNVNLIGIIDKVKEIITKNNEKMAFMSISDEEDTIEIILFPKVYMSCLELKKGDIIKISGKVERRSDLQIIASSVEKIKE